MLEGRSVLNLLRDYDGALERLRELPRQLRERLEGGLEAYRRFISRNAHHLEGDPLLCFVFAVASGTDTRVQGDAQRLFEAGYGLPRSWLRLLNPPEHTPNPALVRVLTGHSGWV